MEIRAINSVNFQGRNLAKGNKIKTWALAGLLATSPLTTKAQVYTNGGERILARDTVELFKGKTAEALLIDNNGNYNTFEKFALSTFSSKLSKHIALKGKEGFMKNWATQYVDTLVKVFTRMEGESEEYAKYYVAGPQIRRKALFEKETDKLISVFTDKQYKHISGIQEFPHNRMEIPEKLFNELKDFLKLTPVKEEHVVEKPRNKNLDILDWW